jgi:hypothetical protein
VDSFKRMLQLEDAKNLDVFDLPLPKTPSTELCGLKENRTMVEVDGGAREPSVGVCLPVLPR